MPDVLKYLTEGLKLDVQQRGLIIRVGWVTLVTVHIAWICGWFTAFGLPAPFASAKDVAALQEAAYTSARINIANEIRQQVQICKVSTDWPTKYAIATEIDRLQEEYKKYNHGVPYQAQPCP